MVVFTMLLAVRLTLGAADASAKTEDWLPRFREEGLQALARLEEGMDDLDVTIMSEFSDQSFWPRTMECLFHKPWYRITMRRDRDLTDNTTIAEKRMSWEWVDGRNSRYSFSLKKLAPSDPYLVENIGPPAREMDGLTHGYFCRSLHLPWKVMDRSLRDWVGMPGVELKKVRPVQHDGKICALLQMTYGNPDQELQVKAGVAGPFSAEIVLDPERYWCVWTAKFNSFGRVKGKPRSSHQEYTIEFGPPIDQIPMPKIVRIRTTYDPTPGTDGKPYVSDETHTLLKIVRRTATEREFSMSAFGLPEMTEATFDEPRSYLWLWLIGLGICAILAAAVLRRKFSRAAI